MPMLILLWVAGEEWEEGGMTKDGSGEEGEKNKGEKDESNISN